MNSDSTDVVFEAYGFQLYKDGHVVRSGRQDRVAAGFDAETGVTSKDVVIDAATGVTARLYLPTIQQTAAAPTPSEPLGDNNSSKLPVLVFFHGGYFIVGSPAEPMYHRYVNSLVARARVVAVSVRYRLAPEDCLPAAYDDSWAALTWAVTAGAAADPWLADHGDLGRVFLVGVSAGGNATHNMAIDAGVNGLPAPAPQVVVEGVVLLHPSFSGERKMEEEEAFWRANNDRWRIIFPGAAGGVDNPRINPTAAGAPSLAMLAGKRLLVCTASEDPRALRAKAYAEAVRASGWHGEVEWFESEGEGHGFFVLNPSTCRADELMDRVVAFINKAVI